MPSFTMTEGGFAVGDYVVFGTLCSLSCAGGIWYSAVGSRTKAVRDLKDYLLGGKSMSTFPVAMSLIASYVSGVTILGTPAEIYNYGTQYWLVIVGVALSCLIVATMYLPVFCTLRLSSSYEYLQLRFNRHVRAVASFLFLLDEVLFLPMVIYVPALAFNQLTGFNVFAVAGGMVLICGLYTSLGGLRAVVWTDSWQTGVMFIGVFLVAIAGTLSVGGVSTIFETAAESGRLELSNWSFVPYERQTGWGAVIGGFLYWTCFNSVNQTMVQRYISLPSKRKAITALGIFCIGAMLAISLCVWCGLAAWTAWVQGGCDPRGAPLVDDRLLPAFVTYVANVQRLPGLAGVFLAGVFGAGLSSLSAVLNACALVVVEDIMHGWMQIRLRPMVEGILARSVTGILAVSSLLMLLVIQKLGGVLGVATALSAIASSSTCGIFTLGMGCWWVGPRGAIAGGIAGAVVAGTISMGTQVAAATGLRSPPLNFTSECVKNASFVFEHSTVDPESLFPLFRLSYHWIAPLGLLATILVGAIVGWFFDERDDSKMDAELYFPLVWRWLPPDAIERAGEIRRIIATKEMDTPAPSSPLILGKITDKQVPKDETSR
ncbi:sodium-coupled monocarboxylate transporter 1-like isoform X1 [Pieris brassicae]|uniref:sodium-coupled monocarboxylate transporter 1-like isoform X1 n=1 Tax=Pieris brassicae TaxID=7116 RepID=UPI001E661D12|nr:sodium-coupled monocarboxylate transporter 1-like isoform X1 [Pieris brassicae]XP_045514675.1 sodium-coupled monocarboxylate transporter 1-like isoform X1 [Pieris brassicae]